MLLNPEVGAPNPEDWVPNPPNTATIQNNSHVTEPWSGSPKPRGLSAEPSKYSYNTKQ